MYEQISDGTGSNSAAPQENKIVQMEAPQRTKCPTAAAQPSWIDVMILIYAIFQIIGQRQMIPNSRGKNVQKEMLLAIQVWANIPDEIQALDSFHISQLCLKQTYERLNFLKAPNIF